MPRGPKTYLKVTPAELADLFNVSENVIRGWVHRKKLKVSSLRDIIDKYNNRHKLDGRMLRIKVTEFSATHIDKENEKE